MATQVIAKGFLTCLYLVLGLQDLIGIDLRAQITPDNQKPAMDLRSKCMAGITSECPSATPDPIEAFQIVNLLAEPGANLDFKLIPATPTGTCLVAMFVMDDVIVEQHIDDISQLEPLETSYDTPGTYRVLLYLSNNASMQFSQGIIEIDAKMRGHNDTVIAPAELGEISYMSILLETGTRFCVFSDWSDSMVENYCLTDVNELAPLGHIYDEVGEYEVCVTLNNVHNIHAHCMIAYVENKVVGLTIKPGTWPFPYPGFTPGENITVTLEADVAYEPPNHVNCSFIDTLTGEELHIQAAPFDENLTQYLTFSLDDLGYKSIVINCSNHISYQDDMAIELEIQHLIQGVSLTHTVPEWPAVPYGEEVFYTLTIENGTNVTTTIDWGDSSTADILTPPDNISEWTQPTVNGPGHTYQPSLTNGIFQYDITVTTENRVNGSIQFIFPITVMFMLETIDLLVDPITPLIVPYSLALTTIPSGTFGAFYCDSVFSNGDTNTSEPTSLTPDFLQTFTVPGDLSISTTCWNNVSSITATNSTERRIAIVGFAVDYRSTQPQSEYITILSSDTYNFDVHIDDGTSVDIMRYCDWEGNPGSSGGTTVSGDSDVTLSCGYSLSGNYTVNVTADNYISFDHDYFLLEVLKAVDAIIFTTNTPISTLTGTSAAVIFNISIPGPEYPTGISLYTDLMGNGFELQDISGTQFAFGEPELRTINLGIGAYYSEVKVENHLSSLTVSAQALVVQPIQSLALDFAPNALVMPALVEATIPLAVDLGSHATFFIDYGDGSYEYVTPSNIILPNSYNFFHTYASIGDYDIYVNATNPLDQIIEATIVTVTAVYPLIEDNIDIIHPDVVAIQDSLITFTITNPRTPVDQLPPSGTVRAKLGNTEVFAEASFSDWPIEVEVDYSSFSLGSKTVKVYLDNVATSTYNEYDFQLAERIEGAEFTAPSIALEDESVDFIFSFEKGSGVSIRVHWSAGSTSSMSGSSTSFSTSKTFSNPGNYSIAIIFENIIGNVTFMHMIDVREKLDLIVTTNAPVSTNKDLIITCTLQPNKDFEIVSFQVLTGDGGELVYPLELITADTLYEIKYQYDKDGDYDLVMVMDNVVSTQTFDEVICVDQPIEGLNFTVFSLTNETDEELGILFEPETDIYFFGFYLGGTDVNVKLDIGGFAIVEGEVAMHNFADAGTYTVTIFANNCGDQKNVSQQITVASPVGIRKLDIPPKIYLVDNLPIDIELDFAKNICFHFNFLGKISHVWCYESKEGLCMLRAEGCPINDIRLKKNESAFHLLPLFKAGGDYEMTLWAYTELKQQQKTEELHVQRYACEDPTVDWKLEKPGGSADNPWCVLQGVYLDITSMDMDASTDCRETSYFNTKWQIFNVTLEDLESEEPYVHEKVVVDFELYLSAEEGSLKPGLYRVCLMLLMREFEAFNSSDCMFLKVVLGPLVARISPDLYWTEGNQDPIEMDATKMSQNPNVGNIEGFNYEWFCHRLEEEAFNLTSNVSQDDPNWSLVPIPASPTRGPGCFGTGPGKLDTDAGLFEFNPTSMDLGTYVFDLRVSIAGQASLGKQILTIVQGQPVKVLIRRDMTDMCPDRYNIRSTLNFYTDCLNCGEIGEIPVYKWEMLHMNETKIDMADYMVVESTTGGLNSKLTLDHAPLLEGRDYLLQLYTNVSNPDYVNSTTKVLVKTSTPPYNGTCKMIPRKSTFLDSPVTVECEDWKDDDFVEGRMDELALYIEAEVGNKTIKIPGKKMFLPIGDPTDSFNVRVHVYVTDPCGSSTLDTQLVQVKPANISGVTEVEYAAEFLKKLDTEGMRLESILDASAIIAILASFDLSDLSDPKIAELQKDMIAVLTTLLTVGAEYPASAILAMAKAAKELGSTLSDATSNDDIASMFAILDSLSNEMKKMRSLTDTYSLATSLGSLAGSCLQVHFSKQEGEVGTTPDPNGVPNALDVASPEEQAAAAARNKVQLEKNLKAAANCLEQLEEKAIKLAAGVHHDISLGTPDMLTKAILSSPQAVYATKIETSESKTELKAIDVTCDDPAFQASFSRYNIYGFSESAKHVSGRISKLRMHCRVGEDGPLEPVDVHGLVVINLLMHPGDRIDVNMTESVIDVNTSMIYFTLPAEHNGVGFVLDFKPELELYTGQTLHVFIKFKAKEEYEYKPTQTSYDMKAVLPCDSPEDSDNRFTVVIPDNMDVTPMVYIGVLYVNDSYNCTSSHAQNARRKKRSTPVNDGNAQENQTDIVVPDDMILKNTSQFAFQIHATLTTCHNWDTEKEEWLSEVCKLDNTSTTENVRCACTESTARTNAISPGFTPPGINTIDFSKVFSNFFELLAANAAVFAVTSSTITIYIIILIWARQADRKDLMKWMTQPLIDNDPGDSYLYHISVVTGMRAGSGTKSNVRFIISGENADTGIRQMTGQHSYGFGRGTNRGFLMRTSETLGQLTYFRIWHDNSGSWHNRNWYLDNIVVDDLQTKESFFFLCDRWLAVDEEGGQIERVLPIAGQEQVLKTKNLFSISSRRKITDEHLWVSVFARPERNTFTRAQRLTCGVTLLFISMITSAMWYRTPDETTNDSMVRLGPFVLSLDVLYISVMASLTSIPLSTIIILFFQKARPREPKEGELKTGLEPSTLLKKKKEELSEAEALEVKKYKRKYPLPWWFAVIAWILAVLTINAAAFFIVLYSLDWGKEVAEAWLSAFFLTFFENILLIQPVKVIAVALLISCICKKLDQEDEEKEIAEMGYDSDSNKDDTGNGSKGLLPLKDKKLARAQYIGLRTKRMVQISQELILHLLFLVLVMYLAWGSRISGSDYLIKRTVLGMLQSDAPGDYMSIQKVSDGAKMWTWIRETLLPNIYWKQQYTGEPTPRWSRAYINDQNAVRLGTVRLRQLRIEEEQCAKAIPENLCRPEYGFFAQQDRHFTPGWKDYINETQKDNIKNRLEKAFVYQSFIDLQNIPYLGIINTYGGGGYVAELGQSSTAALSLNQDLINTDWVDKKTRAIFFETTIYNVNAHLFASIIALFEFPPGGGVLPRLHVDTFHAYVDVGVRGDVTIAMMVIFCIVLIVLAVLHIIRIKENPSMYFNEVWNIVEVIFFFMAFVCVGMYGTKEAYTRYITNKISEDKDANIGYMQLSTYEIGYNAVVGITVFIITCKTLRILNFSKQVRDLALSLRLVRKDLLSYVIVFAHIYMAFGLFAMVVFGRHLIDYSSFAKTLQSLFSTLLGNCDYDGLRDVSGFWGPLFIIIYAVVITFVLINLFIGIVTAAFDEARIDTSAVFESDVWEYLKLKILVILGLRKPETEEHVQEDSDNDDCEINLAVPEAMRREPRAALHSLDVHLHFLNTYVDQMLKVEKSKDAGLKYQSTQTSIASESKPHLLDTQIAALLWDDIPDDALAMMVKSPEKYFAKKSLSSTGSRSTSASETIPSESDETDQVPSTRSDVADDPDESDTRGSSPGDMINPMDLIDRESDVDEPAN